jgi:hypothetical protein
LEVKQHLWFVKSLEQMGKTGFPLSIELGATRLQQSFTQLHEAYQRPVFDEIAIVGLAPKPSG